jgi:methionine-rich copper-binding protein CopC
MSRLLLSITILAIAALPDVAMARAELVSASPAANATVVKPTKLTLRFSEKLLAPMSGIELVMTGMPGMADHPPMPIKGFKTAVEGDGKTLVITLPRALPAGSYDLSWHAADADQQRIEGKYSFTVK